MLAHRKASAQGLAHQAVHRHRAQVVAFQPQQGDGAAAEVAAQGRDQPLQAHGGRQFGHQIGEQERFHHG